MRYRSSKYTLDETFFEKIDTENKAYFLGLLYADGYNQEKRGRYISLQLQEKDKEILQLFKSAISSNSKLLFIDKNNCNHQNHYRLQLNSKKLSKDLARAGCWQNKSKNLMFPTVVPLELIHHFIRGYFDGDGSVWEGKRKTMRIKDSTTKLGVRDRIIHNVKFNITGTTDVISGIQNILIRLASFPNRKINTSKKIYNCCQLEYSGRLQMKKFHEFIYNNATVYFKRKRDKFESIINYKFKL